MKRKFIQTAVAAIMFLPNVRATWLNALPDSLVIETNYVPGQAIGKYTFAYDAGSNIAVSFHEPQGGGWRLTESKTVVRGELHFTCEATDDSSGYVITCPTGEFTYQTFTRSVARSKVSIAEEYDAEGYLISAGITFRDTVTDEVKVIHRMTVTYDDDHRPRAFDLKDGDGRSKASADWLYNESGRLLSYTLTSVLNGEGIYDTGYYYYPSRITGTGAVAAGDNGRGSIDLTFTLPPSSFKELAFTVTLPEGFSLPADAVTIAEGWSRFKGSVSDLGNRQWRVKVRSEFHTVNPNPYDGSPYSLMGLIFAVADDVKRGTYSVPLSDIRLESTTVRKFAEPATAITLPVERPGVGNACVDAIRVWGFGSNLHVNAPHPLTLYIYTSSGTLHREQSVSAGQTILSLPPGAYLVKAGATVGKVVIR
jgi:hypothetical protein